MRTLPSGASTTWAYAPNGFVSSIVGRVPGGGALDTHFYTRDPTGNVTVGSANAQNFTYGYDNLSRLTSASVLGVNYSWQYDLAGNRTQQIAGGVTTSYSYNSADQLTAVNSAAVSTDANGNVTQDETGGVYSWDVRGRLKSLTRNGVTSLFGYNPDDLRVSKTVNGTQTTYLLDGESVVQEKSSGVATDLLQGPGIDNLLERGGIWQTPNALGSSAITLDGNGNGLEASFAAPRAEVWRGCGRRAVRAVAAGAPGEHLKLRAGRDKG